jgi:hypothetical protein
MNKNNGINRQRVKNPKKISVKKKKEKTKKTLKS